MTPNSLGENLWDANYSGEQDSRWDIYPNAFGGSRFRAVARGGALSSPVFVYGLRNETAYSSDTETKYIEPLVFLACLKYWVFENLSQPLNTGILDAKNVKERLADYRHEWMIQSESQNKDLDRVITSPDLWADYPPRFSYGEY